MFLIGLTGGIASGKTTVGNLLASFGAQLIDADAVAREVVTIGSTGLAAVVEKFGRGILNESGELNRERLGEIVFTDPAKRLDLENILHPLISQRTAELIAKCDGSVVVYAVPLLVEANVDYPFDMILTVEAGLEIQIERLMKTRGLSKIQAQERIAAQVSRSEREKRAEFVIVNSGTLSQLEEQVALLWPKIEQAAGAKF